MDWVGEQGPEAGLGTWMSIQTRLGVSDGYQVVQGVLGLFPLFGGQHPLSRGQRPDQRTENGDRLK